MTIKDVRPGQMFGWANLSEQAIDKLMLKQDGAELEMCRTYLPNSSIFYVHVPTGDLVHLDCCDLYLRGINKRMYEVIVKE